MKFSVQYQIFLLDPYACCNFFLNDDDEDDDEYVNDNDNMDEMKQKNYACMYEEIERNLSVQKS